MKGRAFKLMTVFGMPIRVHITWFIVFALITWTLAETWFPEHGPVASRDLPKSVHWMMAVTAALLLFVSVLLHELGHCFLARRHHIPVRGITLFLFGGVAEISEEPPSPRAEAEVTLAGWAVTVTIALGALLLYRLLPRTTPAQRALVGVVHYLMFINLLLLAFNAVPGFPLDGGRLLRALLWWTTGNLRRATRIASAVGASVGLLLVVLGVLVTLGGEVVGGVWFIIVGLFLRSAAQRSYEQLLIRRALEGVPIGELMSTEVVSMDPETTLEEAVEEWFLRHRYDGFPICGPEGLEGMLTLDHVRGVERGLWPQRTVAEVMDRRAPEYAVPPDMDAVEVLARMARYDIGRIPVVDGGRVVGMVTRRHILDLLRIKADLEELRHG